MPADDGADVAGRLDAAALERAGVPVDADHHLCGPAGLLRDVRTALAARGVPPAPHVPDGPPGSGPAVHFARSGLTVPWDARYPSLLDGSVACTSPPLQAPGPGRVLVCCSTPRTDVVLDR